MAGWHHQCNGPDLGQTLEDGEEQGGLVYCDPWGRKVSDMTGRLNNSGNKMTKLGHSYNKFVLNPDHKPL